MNKMKDKKSYDHLNRCRKNLTGFNTHLWLKKKNSPESGLREEPTPT